MIRSILNLRDYFREVHGLMKKTTFRLVWLTVTCLLLFPPQPVSPQFRGVKLPETALPLDILKTILNEVSGQLAFNNEAVMAAHLPPRPEAEYTGFFFEAEFLAKKLQEYGLDDVRIESIDKGVDPRKWWACFEGELWTTKPELKLLSRLSADAALVIRGTDTVDTEGELVFIDRRDVRKLKEMDFSGKIILTSEYPAWFSDAFTKGALGVISYSNSIRPLDDPDQVQYDMRLYKGDTQNKVFGFKISQRLGYELRDLVLQGQKIVVRARTKTAEYPLKFDTVFASVKGTSPEKKGLMFTAHLFERPQKQGANDNLSGSVVLAEVARTLNALIRQGLIQQPERSVHFLWIEEGSGTMAFFRRYPDIGEKIFGAINMDMVGENLDQNSAFFNIEMPYYSRSTFLSSATRDFADFVFVANLPTFEYQPPTPWMPLPFPIAEKNGSLQSFRYRMTPFQGGSDHGIFIESDPGIPALSFNVWPDKWYHTDKDTPDKSDPTQLKRVAFIAAASALATCSGQEDILESLILETYSDRLLFIQEAVAQAVSNLSRLKTSDKGVSFKNAMNNTNESVRLSKEILQGIMELVAGKPKATKRLDLALAGLDKLALAYAGYLKATYEDLARLNGFRPEISKLSAEEMKLDKIVPRKVKPTKLGEMPPPTALLEALRKNPKIQMQVFTKYNFNMFQEMYLAIDGRRTLGQICDLLSFEFMPVDAADLLDIAKCLEDAKLIETAAQPSK